MAILAAGAGVFAALAGLGVSFRLDTPTGPTKRRLRSQFFVVVNLIFWGAGKLEDGSVFGEMIYSNRLNRRSPLAHKHLPREFPLRHRAVRDRG
ncbi:MAG: hypothetical protein Ct9H300mP13_0450 [Gammaproteobacteria bacterium]|nr:MAG: hypothetical protein Ct9H300mP13_0450 [Gammaproteobacteria bacterium]